MRIVCDDTQRFNMNKKVVFVVQHTLLEIFSAYSKHTYTHTLMYSQYMSHYAPSFRLVVPLRCTSYMHIIIHIV